jgi:hypothetical protein
MPNYLFWNAKTDDYLVIRARSAGELPHPAAVPHLEYLESNAVYSPDMSEILYEHSTRSYAAYDFVDLIGDGDITATGAGREPAAE